MGFAVAAQIAGISVILPLVLAVLQRSESLTDRDRKDDVGLLRAAIGA